LTFRHFNQSLFWLLVTLGNRRAKQRRFAMFETKLMWADEITRKGSDGDLADGVVDDADDDDTDDDDDDVEDKDLGDTGEEEW